MGVLDSLLSGSGRISGGGEEDFDFSAGSSLLNMLEDASKWNASLNSNAGAVIDIEEVQKAVSEIMGDGQSMAGGVCATLV